jgi:hypothetical protein
MLEEARSFFKLLWPDTSLVDHLRLTLWRLPSKTSLHVPPSGAYAALEGFADLPVATGAFDEPYEPATGPPRTHAMYYGVGLREPGVTTRGGDAQVHAWPGVWVDLDYGKVGHAGESYPPNDSAAMEIVDKFPLLPTMIVQSGHGFHLYWLFDKPFLGERKHFTGILTGIQKKIRELAEPFAVDKTDDVGRVLGIPGLWNCKALVPPVRVAIFLDDGPRYGITELEQFRGRPGRPAKSPPPAAAGQVVEGRHPLTETNPAGGGGGTLPETVDAPKKRGRPPAAELPAWVAGVHRRVKNTTDAEKRRRAELLLAGEPFAKAGERNNVCNSMVGLLTNYVFKEKPTATPDEIYDTLFAKAIVAMALLDDDPSNPALHKDEVLGQLHRMWALVVEEDERDKEQTQRFADALRRGALRKKGGGNGGSNGNGHANGNGNGHSTSTALVVRDSGEDAEPANGAYNTPDGLPPVPPPPDHAAIAEAGDPLELLIVQYEDAYFVWRDDQYQSHVSSKALETSLKRDLAFAPGVSWYYEDAKGNDKRKTIQQFKNDYCTVARHLVFDLTNPDTEYDPESETLFVAAAPLRELEPTFSEPIHEWLMLFGGEERWRLLDWIATITDLRYQSCALYASGHPGTGKSLLAQGLAKLWNPFGAPTTLKNIMGNFNADLLKCPLIWADEALPPGCHTTDLRDLVGSSSRAVTQKYIPNADLRGAIRLLLTSNPSTMLSNRDEHQGQDDVAAVAERFFHIDTPPAAAEFLRKLGGQSGGTEHWVDGDLIARHALWLRDHKRDDFKPGKRFLVEGTKTEVHRALVIGGPVSSLVLEWLARFLHKPIPNIAKLGLVLYGNGELLVNTSAITDHWEHYINSHTVYSTTRIGTALRSIAQGVRKGVGENRNRNYWIVDPQYVLDWATQNNIGDAVDMKKAVDREQQVVSEI